MGFYEEDEPGFLQKNRIAVGCGAVIIIALAVWLGQKVVHRTARTRPEQDFVMVSLPPVPRPPPPAPVPVRPAPEPTEATQRMMEQVPVTEMEAKPEEVSKTEQPPDDPQGLGTSIQGDGSIDGFGLRAGNGFGGIVGGTGKSTQHGSGSRWGWYASQVQTRITRILQNNHSTRDADFRVEARIWVDQTGRVTRAKIAQSTGNGALDEAITNQVLDGLILQEPPPDGMPMPIVLRLTARHSNMAFSR